MTVTTNDILQHHGVQKLDTKEVQSMKDLDDILQHAGVKGMKWGVRKDRGGKVSKSAKKEAKQEKASNKLNAYHEKKMKRPKSYYARKYKSLKDAGFKHETSVKTARNMNRGVNAALIYMASPVKLTPYGRQYIKEGVKSFVKVGSREAYNRAYNAATSDKVVRTGKNIVNTIKRNNIRVVNAADFDWNNIIQQSASLDDSLQHAGVKGMKWGVRRSASALRKARKENNQKVNADVKSGKMTKKEGRAQKLENYHKSKRKGVLNAGYRQDYKRGRDSGLSHPNAIRQAKVSQRASWAMVLAPGAIGVAGLAGQGAGALYRKTVTPENIRKGKNVILAAKRSPIRVVDGSAMTNVIKANLQNRITQWSDSLDDSLQHAGVKGMKWGVRKDDKPKRSISTSIDASKTRHKPTLVNRLNGTLVPLPAAVAITAMDVHAQRKVKRAIAKSFNSKPKDFNKKDLKYATAVVRNYSHVKLSSDGKTSKFNHSDLEDILQHYGVKGMKWGVRRTASQLQNGVKSVGKNPVVLKVKRHVAEVKNSKARERSWSKIDTSGMTTQEINKIALRARLENDLRSSASSKVYRNRDKMSDSELMDTVSHLRAKTALNKSAMDANKSQRETAAAIVATAAPIAVRYALTGTVSAKDLARTAAGMGINLIPKAKPDKEPSTVSGTVAKSTVDNVQKEYANQR